MAKERGRPSGMYGYSFEFFAVAGVDVFIYLSYYPFYEPDLIGYCSFVSSLGLMCSENSLMRSDNDADCRRLSCSFVDLKVIWSGGKYF